MRQIRWTTEASDQFVGAVTHIQDENLSAARRVAQTVIDRIEQLAAFPALGRTGEVKGTASLLAHRMSLFTGTQTK